MQYEYNNQAYKLQKTHNISGYYLSATLPQYYEVVIIRRAKRDGNTPVVADLVFTERLEEKDKETKDNGNA